MATLATLPYLVFTKIVRNLSPIEIIKMAMSDEMIFERLARLASLVESVEFNVRLDKKMIEVNFGDASKDFKIVADGSKTSSPSTLPTTSEEMLNAFTRVKQLFPGTIGTLKIDLKTLEETTLLKLENIQCKRLNVSGVSRKLNKKRVAQVIGSIKVSQECLIDCDMGMKMLSLPPTEKLTINYSTGFTGSDLFRLAGTTKVVELSESELDSKDMNNFIKKWLNGVETVTSMVQVCREDEDDWNVHQIIKDIPTLKPGTVKRDKSFVISRDSSGEPETVTTIQNGIDIQRADGLLATIATEGPTLMFAVWHQRFELADLISAQTEKCLRAQERCAQLAEIAERMRQRIQENIERITNTEKNIEKMEKKKDDNNIALQYFLRSLRMDVNDFQSDNIKIQEELAKNAAEIEKAEEERVKLANDLETFAILADVIVA